MQVLRREAGEETGWRIARPRPLAVLHYHLRHAQTQAGRRIKPYAYPDFSSSRFTLSKAHATTAAC